MLHSLMLHPPPSSSGTAYFTRLPETAKAILLLGDTHSPCNCFRSADSGFGLGRGIGANPRQSGAIRRHRADLHMAPSTAATLQLLHHRFPTRGAVSIRRAA